MTRRELAMQKFYDRVARLDRLLELDAPVLIIVSQVRLILRGLLQARLMVLHSGFSSFWAVEGNSFPGFWEAWRVLDERDTLAAADLCTTKRDGKYCRKPVTEVTHLCHDCHAEWERENDEQERWEREHPEEMLRIDAECILANDDHSTFSKA